MSEMPLAKVYWLEANPEPSKSSDEWADWEKRRVKHWAEGDAWVYKTSNDLLDAYYAAGGKQKYLRP